MGGWRNGWWVDGGMDGWMKEGMDGWWVCSGSQAPLPSCAAPSLATVSWRRIFQVQADGDANACVNEGVVASL